MRHSHGWGLGGEGAGDGGQDMGHAMGAKMWGMATDGARDGAKTRVAQTGGMWAYVRGVDVGKTRVMAMCSPRGPGCAWCVHEGHGQGWWQPMVCGLGAEVAVLQVDRLREALLRAESRDWTGCPEYS